MKKNELLMTLAMVAIVSLVVACSAPSPFPTLSASPSPAPPPSAPSPPQLSEEEEGPWLPPAPPYIHYLPPIFNPPPGEFSPSSGEPGTVVHLFGQNFDCPKLQVEFGGVAADILSSTATEIVVKVPRGINPGGTYISITTYGGTAVSENLFKYFVAIQ